MMNNAPCWQALLNKAAADLNVEIVSLCQDINNKTTPRYYHADVRDPMQPKIEWRMKVVNPNHSDVIGIQDCNEYNNCAHAQLAEVFSPSDILRIPKPFNVPLNLQKNYNLAEFVAGKKATTDDLALLAELLSALQLSRKGIIKRIKGLKGRMRRDVNIFNQRIYKERLEHSINGLRGCLNATLRDQVSRAFMALFPRPLSETYLTFAHGDFSFGNLILDGDTVALIDFEHCHIGVGCIDLAHLYVNFIADDQQQAAQDLRAMFEEKAARQCFYFQDNIFKALILERAAGKMNSMKGVLSDGFKRLEKLLFLTCMPVV